jgi:hypothetical protein
MRREITGDAWIPGGGGMGRIDAVTIEQCRMHAQYAALPYRIYFPAKLHCYSAMIGPAAIWHPQLTHTLRSVSQ